MLNYDRLLHLFKGNAAAVEFCRALVFIIHVWDDLIDEDQRPSQDDINHAFYLAMVGIQENAFYRAHEAALRPLVSAAILNWLASVNLERGSDPHGHEIAHITRYYGAEIFLQIMLILGGLRWAAEHGAEVWLMIKEELLPDYLAELELKKK
jgi:hypothetical protein